MSEPKRLKAMALAAAALAFFTAAGAAAPAGPADAGLMADKAAVVKGNNEAALDLYGRLRKQEGNLFFSPFSISTALAMTYAGARGETADQMADVLRFGLEQGRLHPAFAALVEDLQAAKEKKGYELSVANALWGQEGFEFLADFLGLVRESYGAGLNEVDFKGAAEEARKTINAWVEKQTRDKIKDLIKPGVLGALTRLVLTNAIYFKGDWASQFDPKRTADAPFTLAGGDKVNVPMMSQKAEFGYMDGDGFQALELPYVGEELSMVVLLPAAGGVKALEDRLTPENVAAWTKGLGKVELTVFLPKFKMTWQTELAPVLGAMGMGDAFSAARADFSGMTGRKDLFISNVIHKAFVEVNEEGTEAAAATAVVMKLTAVARPLVFRADHPFLFLIRDTRSGGILFMGRVMNPAQ